VINIPIKLENKLIDVISPISDLVAPIVFRNTGKKPNRIEKVTNWGSIPIKEILMRNFDENILEI